MTAAPTDIETKLANTLQAVADRTEPVTQAGRRYVHSENGARVTGDGGYEDLAAIFHSTENGRFSIDRDSSLTLAGREVFNSFAEGVAEELEDGTWIMYQVEFDYPRLERLVTATTVVDGQLVFEDVEAVMETIATVADTDDPNRSVISSFPTEDVAPLPGGPVLGFLLVTAAVESPEEALYYNASFGGRSIAELEVDGLPGVAFFGRPALGVSTISWSPVNGRIAHMVVFGGDQDEVTEFAAGMRIVNAETWEAELSGS